MSDPKTMKKNLLQDLLMQRSKSSTQSPEKVKFLSSYNPSLRGSRASLKSQSGPESPKIKTSRLSSKRLHLPAVFRSRKDTTPSPRSSKKSEPVKKNSKRDGVRNRRPSSFYEDEKKSISFLKSPRFRRKDTEKNQKKLAVKVTEKHTPKKEKLKSPLKEPTPNHVLYTTFAENNLTNLLQNDDKISVIPWKQNKTIPESPGRNLTKVSFCTSCGHLDDKPAVRIIEITPPSDDKQSQEDSSDDKNTYENDNIEKKISEKPTEIVQSPNIKSISELSKVEETILPLETLKKPPLARSNSDPLSPSQSRILLQQKQQVREAKITYSQSLKRKIRRRHTDSDLNETDTEINLWVRTHGRNNPINEVFCNKNIMPKMRNSVSDIYPLLRTKIPEEQVQNDGSVTFRKTRTERDKNADRDSGVDVDNKIQRANSKDSDCDVDNEATANTENIRNLNIKDSDDDTLKSTKPQMSAKIKDEEVKSLDKDTRTRKRRTSEEEDNLKWDMYALLRRFECVEWDLSPAANLKRQTLDLDNCNLNCVPAAVTEIEYYAFRDVEAVSLNHNNKITNADVLGKLADLRIINMWGCNLKAIPQTWSRLTKLQMLGLGNNRELTEFGPLKHLTNITWLDLGGCGLKKIPDAVTNMMKLKVLALGCNPGIEVGDEICSLWDLKKLGLNDCELEEIPKAVFCLVKITHLHLDNNFIRQIDQQIVQLKELQELTVTGNDDITFPKLLSQCDTIQCIVVDIGKDLTRMSGTLKNRIKHMPSAASPVREFASKPRRVSCT